MRDSSEALQAALSVVVRVVAELPAAEGPLHVTHRVKTVGTLIDKLRRGTALSRMQDVVGIRVVGCPFRTGLQHAWANATEHHADRWGRQIRYGQPPTGVDSAEVAVRALALQHWLRASEAIARLESAAADQLRSEAVRRTTDANARGPSLTREEHPTRIKLLEPNWDLPVRTAVLELDRALQAAGPEFARSLQVELAALESSRELDR